jgi:hypothetical protein
MDTFSSFLVAELLQICKNHFLWHQSAGTRGDGVLTYTNAKRGKAIVSKAQARGRGEALPSRPSSPLPRDLGRALQWDRRPLQRPLLLDISPGPSPRLHTGMSLLAGYLDSWLLLDTVWKQSGWPQS